MSRDGCGQLITVDVVGNDEKPPFVACGARFVSAHGGRLRGCTAGHIHCKDCGQRVFKFRKGWTHVCQKA
jgi:hypothetical protein